MAGAVGKAIEAGAAFVRLFIKNDIGKGLQKALDGVSAGASKIGGAFTVAGGVVGAGLAGAVGLFSSMGDEMSKLSDRTGASVESLSGLKYAAEQSDVSFETMGRGLKEMMDNIAQAKLGDPLAALKGRDAETSLKSVADYLQRIEDPNKRIAAANKIFGKSGFEMLAMLKDGSRGITELTDRAQQLGLVMKGEDAAAATKFGDSLSDLWKSAKMAAFHIGAGLAEKLQPVADWLLTASGRAIRWIEANRGMVTVIAALAAGAVLVGGALIGVSAVASAASMAIGGLTAIIGALTSPVVLVSAAVLGIGYALLKTTGTLDRVLSDMSIGWQVLADEGSSAWNSIAESISAGNLQEAVEVAWAFVKLEWERGVAELEQLWLDLDASTGGVLSDILSVAVGAWNGIQAGWGIASSWLSESFGGLGTSASSVFDDIKSGFSLMTADWGLTWEYMLTLGKSGLVGIGDSFRGLWAGLAAMLPHALGMFRDFWMASGEIATGAARGIGRALLAALRGESMANIMGEITDQVTRVTDQMRARFGQGGATQQAGQAFADAFRANAQSDEGQMLAGQRADIVGRMGQAREQARQAAVARAAAGPNAGGIVAAQDAMNAALQAARDANDATVAGRPNVGRRTRGRGLPQLLDRAGGSAADGTFSGAAARMLGMGTGPIDRMAAGIDEIAGNTRPLRAGGMWEAN